MPENEKKQRFSHTGGSRRTERGENHEGTGGADLPDDQLCV